jgi:hypothetical protein
MKTPIFVLILLISNLVSEAQEKINVKMYDLNIRLYKGYRNQLAIEILDPKGKADSYKFHASATNADVYYTSKGKIDILPRSSGSITLYAERNDTIFKAGELNFEAVEPPPVSDASFREAMGITDKDPKTSLPSVRIFSPGGKVISESDLDFAHTGAANFVQGKNLIKSFLIRKQGENWQYLWGDLKLASAELEIKQLSKYKFEITPKPGARKASIQFCLNDKLLTTQEYRIAKPKKEGK